MLLIAKEAMAVELLPTPAKGGIVMLTTNQSTATNQGHRSTLVYAFAGK